MRNKTILFFSLCLLIVLSCTNTQEEYNKQAVLEPILENKKKAEEPINKDLVKKDIEKNNDHIKSIEKEINALLKDF